MRDRLASEIEEERAARLQRMSANQRLRLASETEEERAARLQQMSANQHHRLGAEIGSEREARGFTKFTQLHEVTSQFVMFISCALRAQMEDGTGSRPDNLVR